MLFVHWHSKEIWIPHKNNPFLSMKCLHSSFMIFLIYVVYMLFIHWSSKQIWIPHKNNPFLSMKCLHSSLCLTSKSVNESTTKIIMGHRMECHQQPESSCGGITSSKKQPPHHINRHRLPYKYSSPPGKALRRQGVESSWLSLCHVNRQ